jgi:hypothetical protein
VRTEIRPETVERVVEKRVEVPVQVVEVRERVVFRTVRVAMPERGTWDGTGRQTPPVGLGASEPAVLPALRIPAFPGPAISQEVFPAAIASPTAPLGVPHDGPGRAGLPDLAPDGRLTVACN